MTPVFNTVVVSIIVACIAGFVPSDYLWDSVSFGTLVAFSLVAISIIVLRRTRPGASLQGAALPGGADLDGGDLRLRAH